MGYQSTLNIRPINVGSGGRSRVQSGVGGLELLRFFWANNLRGKAARPEPAHGASRERPKNRRDAQGRRSGRLPVACGLCWGPTLSGMEDPRSFKALHRVLCHPVSDPAARARRPHPGVSQKIDAYFGADDETQDFQKLDASVRTRIRRDRSSRTRNPQGSITSRKASSADG